MKAICYKNNKMTIPDWSEDLSKIYPFGYAYETEKHFVHFYGSTDNNMYIIHPGLTVIQGKSGLLLEDWVKQTFGATDIQEMDMEAGKVNKEIWRPGLFYWNHINQALDVQEENENRAKKSIQILLEKLEEIFLYVEPSTEGLQSYSHKIRELLMLACTEMENYFVHYAENIKNLTPNNGQYFNTSDYIKLKDTLFLNEFVIKLKNCSIANFNPFVSWQTPQTTKTLTCYDIYNKTKHHFDKNFKITTLKSAIDAVCGCLILYSVKYGVSKLQDGKDYLSVLFYSLFQIKLEHANIKSFYIFKLDFDANQTRTDLCCIGMDRYISPFIYK